MRLDYFNGPDFLASLKKLFNDLNIPIRYFADKPALPKDILNESYKPHLASHNSIDKVYFLGMVDDKAFRTGGSGELFDSERDFKKEKSKRDYDGLYIFGVTLRTGHNQLPTRTALAEITRAFNREFNYAPVVILAKYDGFISLASCERQAYKQTWREGEKLGKVSLLRDINIEHPHTGHLKILDDLKLKSDVRTFDALYKQWREVFDVQLLNKRFYQEIANWYFWAMSQVEFPKDAGDEKEVRNATSLIRLLTRLIFVWFLKEKHLVPEELFDKKFLDDVLNYKDKTGSTYYKAVLQNLFFATLNTPMKKDNPKSRIFIEEATNKGFVNDGYLQSGYFRYKRFMKNPELLLEKYSSIPFLNGGLFECLDDKVDGKEIRIDCFSNEPNNEDKIKVPDELFFGTDRSVDLNKIYDTKNKDYRTRGLINILNSYKFTVAENTPVEEDIALDPELLGKVFENLLASYNPETGTTARKATGSFYTPREIVNYMVDESIIAYLNNKLKENEPDIEKEDELRQLLSYTDEQHKFDNQRTLYIIKAIKDLNLLDPACGSGAFPMGALHKLVYILHKLDPENILWKEIQKEEIIGEKIEELKRDKKVIENVSDSKLREQAIILNENRLNEIEDSFNNDYHFDDYARKLYLIEKCIYGVDIQPIAIQISKLRFFISLIVEQKTIFEKENLGIKPLPNLETKFVAANTLIGLDKPKDTLAFEVKEINDAEELLLKIRKDIFYVNSSTKKKQLAKKEKEARENLKKLLESKGGFGHATAEQISKWDPFNLNASSGWFDPEFMFGISSGFDIVIGNPPYGANIDKIIENILKKEFDYLHTRTFDSYNFFLGVGKKFLNKNGLLTLILPSAFLFQNECAKSRKYFINNFEFKLAVNLGENVFTAVVPSCVVSIKNLNSQEYDIKIKDIRNQNALVNISEGIDYTTISNKDLLDYPDAIIPMNFKDQSIIIKLMKNFESLKSFSSEINSGVTSGNIDVFMLSNDDIQKFKIEKETVKETLVGKDVFRYEIRNSGLKKVIYTYKNINIIKYPNLLNYLKVYEDELSSRVETKEKSKPFYLLHRPRTESLFISPKIIVREASDDIKASLDLNNAYVMNTLICIQLKDREIIWNKFVLALLNSSLQKYIFQSISQEIGRTFAKVRPINLGKLPIVKPSVKIQTIVSRIVDYIMFSKKSESQNSTDYLERLIDAKVYELYFPDEIKAAGAEISKHLENLPELKDSQSDEEKLAIIDKVYKELSNPKHPVSQAMFRMEAVEEVRIIEGKKK